MSTATASLALGTFAASVVEMVEALTILMAMGVTRGWRSTLAGAGVALVALAAFTAVAGTALSRWLPEAALQLAVGSLLLVFGQQWLRKAVLRSAGRKAMHDEDAIYAAEVEVARAAGRAPGSGLDRFAFAVAFKGVFLEGAEVVFIVITFGLNADNMPVAVAAAVAGFLFVAAVGVVARRPLARVPENTLKFGVGLLLCTFGTFWAVEGLGVLRGAHESLAWPGGELALPVLLLAWLGVARLLVRRLRPAPRVPAVA